METDPFPLVRTHSVKRRYLFLMKSDTRRRGAKAKLEVDSHGYSCHTHTRLCIIHLAPWRSLAHPILGKV